ncbi:hypothetical protein AFEL58S_01625 [Afipia felis]
MTSLSNLFLSLMVVATSGRRGSTDYLEGLGCTKGGFYRGIAKFAELLPDRVSDENDEAGAIFAIAYACGEAEALTRAKGAVSSPAAAGRAVDLLGMLAEGWTTDAALARLAASAKPANVIRLARVPRDANG